MSVQSLEGLRRTAERTVDGRALAVGAAVFLLAVAAAALSLHVRKLVRRRRRWRSFHARIHEMGLSEELKATLESLARAWDVNDPCRVIDNSVGFEQAVHHAMSAVVPGPDGEPVQWPEENIQLLRRELRWDASASSGLMCSTRELEPGEVFSLCLSTPDGDMMEVDGTLEQNTERYMAVELQQPQLTELRGASVVASAYTRHGPVCFDGQVVHADTMGKTIRLSHTMKIQSMSRRRYNRVSVDQPVEVILARDDREQAHTVVLCDLSPGGMAIRSETKLDVAEPSRLWIDISPGNLLDRPERLPEDCHVPSNCRVEADVISERTLPDGGVVYPCQFVVTTREQRLFLLKLLRVIKAQ